MTFLTLPPWLRAIQQTYWAHFAVAAAIVAGSSAFTCFGAHNEFSIACLKLGVIAGGIYLFGALQAGVKSPAYKPDGTVNQRVMQVVAQQAIVADATKGGK